MLAYGLLNHLSETSRSIARRTTTIDLSVTELQLGALAGFSDWRRRHALCRVGAGAAQQRQGQSERRKLSDDIEREDILNLRLGVAFALTSVSQRADAVLVGETTITLSVGTVL